MSLSNTPAPPDPGAEADGTTAALAEPTTKVTARWVTGLVLVNVGINAAFFGPINVFIGQQAIGIDEANKEAILSLVTGCGAAVSLVANPLVWRPLRPHHLALWPPVPVGPGRGDPGNGGAAGPVRRNDRSPDGAVLVPGETASP